MTLVKKDTLNEKCVRNCVIFCFRPNMPWEHLWAAINLIYLFSSSLSSVWLLSGTATEDTNAPESASSCIWRSFSSFFFSFFSFLRSFFEAVPSFTFFISFLSFFSFLLFLSFLDFLAVLSTLADESFEFLVDGFSGSYSSISLHQSRCGHYGNSSHTTHYSLVLNELTLNGGKCGI